MNTTLDIQVARAVCQGGLLLSLDSAAPRSLLAELAGRLAVSSSWMGRAGWEGWGVWAVCGVRGLIVES